MIDVAPWIIPAAFVVAIVFVGMIASFIPVRLFIEARFSGVRLGLGSLIGMRLRKVSPPNVVRPLIAATKAGIALSTNELEAHYLAGGSVDRVVRALMSILIPPLRFRRHATGDYAVAANLSRKPRTTSI